ncbi:DUF1365 domain-containing protein [Tamilnaduibacter salinus]|uniref:DUF1365 domain-containing protein n=1 Tax=Tamilnaduibacter salinus TaxID=1484056 RepID=A0A2A2HZT7_9GAMM|nr:DUF1365 domain-containing protein [Tamilnaduibacter salinus]
MKSQWLHGRIRHRRFTPVHHGFDYHTGMFAIDLSEWATIPRLSRLLSLERFNWLSLRRADYFRPDNPDLDAAVRDQVEQATGWRPDGAIQLITHPRYLGAIFNPVSFYCCYTRHDRPGDGSVPRVIASEITNTPWGERHLYCLEGGPVHESDSGWRSCQYRFSKRFHVSPFNDMAQDYQWVFAFKPGAIHIHMNVYQDGFKQFDATLSLDREPLTRRALHRHLRRFPAETLKVAAGIYWHALRLKLKGALFRTHPDKRAASDAAYRQGSDDQGCAVHDESSSVTGRVTSWRN